MGAIEFIDNQGTYKLTRLGKLILLEEMAKS